MAEVLPLINLPSLLLEREEMDAGVVQQIRTALSEASSQYRTLREVVDQLEQRLASGRGNPDVGMLKIGVACYFLGRMERSAELLGSVTTPLAKYYRGLALNELGRFEEAIESLDAAGKAGYAKSEVELHKAASQRGLGQFDKAKQTLESLESYVHKTAEYRYQLGALLAAQGQTRDAITHFEEAIAADPRHPQALFQLAYHNDKAGNDEEAIALYERCLRIPPPRVGTLMNLGILYEDNERYDRAASCYQQVLSIYPSHERARMFLKDARSSSGQTFDEDAERNKDRYNAVMDIPISDFELSVRSRNCLKKMNLNTLGDLTRTTEQQLLNSKNFGETSLTEIKQILSLKGLRLGQAVEQAPKSASHSINFDEYSPQERAHFEKPLSELNLSVRARKCMNRLGIATVGELIAHSADDLLECKNFGVTSLVEVREKLTAFGLKLRGD